MSLSSLSIRRPVFTTVLAIVIVIFGIMGFRELGVREFPQSQRPVISVVANYPGADASVVESQITEPLEEAVNTVAGIKTLSSVSREGRSTIRIEFELGDDLDRAANDIRDRVSSAMRRLPDDADPPTVEKADADGDPIVFLNIQSDERSLLELTEMADNIFKSRFETIQGVGRVDIWGSKEYAMRLWIDPDRLNAYGLTPADVRIALNAANVELPSGDLDSAEIQLIVRTLSRLGDNPEDFNDIVIKRRGENVVRFRDVGIARIGALNERTRLKRDGIEMVGVVLRPQADANQIEIVDEFYRRLAEIEKDLPEDIQLGIGFDTSIFIRDSISEVKQTLLIALTLVCLTIYLFLREIRSAIIPLITIPVSLIGACFIVWMAGFSLNVLTLLSLVLAIGLVVDDAVIVLENVYSKIELGMEPIEAGLQGIREIFLAIIATTLALVAVFSPIIFLGGLTGVLFREFGLTLAGAVVISSFVALTLAPMLCTRILKKRKQHSAFYRATEPFYQQLNSGYRRALRPFLNRPWIALPVYVLALALLIVIFRALPQELAPTDDRNLLVISVSGPQGANFDYMASIMDEVDAVVGEIVPERQALISVTSPGFGAATTINSGFNRLALTPASLRDRSQNDIAQALGPALNEIPGADIFVRQPPSISSGRGAGLPVQFVVEHPDFERLREVVPDFLEAARSRPELVASNVDLKFNQPQVDIQIDRDRASAMGVSARAIAETVQAALSGQRYGYFLKDNQQYQVIGQVELGARNDPRDLARLTVRDDQGRMHTLDNFAEFVETSEAPVRYRYNRFPAATFSANLASGFSLNEGIAAMEAIAAELLDESFSTSLTGQSQEFREASGSLFFVFIMALILIFLVLAAQFESFRDPLLIMLTVPLALVGGLFALWYFGQSLNIFSQIGLIMLIGLIAKNGILVVEFANQRRAAGLPVHEAIENAAAARFRPILMTAISTILGTLPIAMAIGAGSESRTPLGIAVVGGMFFGTFLTLFIIPAAYRAFVRD